MVEEERDRFMSKLLNEEKARKSLEGRLTIHLLMEKIRGFFLLEAFGCEFFLPLSKLASV